MVDRTDHDILITLEQRFNDLLERLGKWETGENPTCIRHNGRLRNCERQYKSIWAVLVPFLLLVAGAFVKHILG